MSVLIKMKSSDFVGDFVKNFEHDKFNILLISSDVKKEKTGKKGDEYKHIYSLPELIPPPHIMNIYLGNLDESKYKSEYGKYLENPDNIDILTTIVRLVAVEKQNVILLCSDNEYEYLYLEALCDYIMARFGLKSYKYKKYKQLIKKGEELSIGDEDKIESTLEDLSKIKKKKIKNTDKEMIENSLKEKSKKDLRKYCKSRNIEYTKDIKKKELIKKIIKFIKKNG